MLKAVDLRAVAESRCSTMSVEIGIEVGITALVAGVSVNAIRLLPQADANNCDEARLKFC